jgi:hypothetical protein
MVKVLKTIIVSILASSAVFAAGADADLNASVEAGYTSNYIINGTSRTKDRAFAGFNIGAKYEIADVYLGGVVIPASETLDESHWVAGVGKGFSLSSNVTLRAEAQVWRHQSSIPNGVDSTEGVVKFALQNKILTPYVKGLYDFNLDQYGYIVGVERKTDVLGWFNVTPSVEWGQFTDYDVLSAKVTASKVIFNHLEPFVEAGWYDNRFQVKNYNFATREFNGDFVVAGGLRWNF